MSILSIHWSRWGVAGLVRRGERGLTLAASVPTLSDDEHALYRFGQDGSLTAVGTEVALHYRMPGSAWRRIAWTDLTRATWWARTGSMELRSTAPDGRAESIRIAADRTLAALAAERIGHLRILRCRVEPRPGVFGIVEAVRVSDRASPQWRVHLADPARWRDPLVRQACREVISELRSQAGC